MRSDLSVFEKFTVIISLPLEMRLVQTVSIINISENMMTGTLYLISFVRRRDFIVF